MIWKPVVAVAAVAAIGASVAGYYFRFGRAPERQMLPGTVETQEVRLSSRVGGRVREVLIREGQTVAAGQELITLEMPELDAQRKQLEAQLAAAKAEHAMAVDGPRDEEIAAAKAAFDAAAARLARMQSGYRAEEVEQARNEFDSLLAELKNAEQDLTRERTLREKGASTTALYEAAIARHGRLLGQVNAAGQKLKMLEKGFRPEEITESQADLARLKANYDLLLAGSRQEEIDAAQAKIHDLEAHIEELDVLRGERTVVAPEAAIVEVIAVRPGDIVAANQPMVRVLRADDMWVKAYISEVDLGRIRVGQKVDVTVDTFPDKPFKGEITYIASAAEFTPRNVQTIDERRHQVFGIRVRVDDPQGVFKAGMAAEVWLPKVDATIAPKGQR